MDNLLSWQSENNNWKNAEKKEKKELFVELSANIELRKLIEKQIFLIIKNAQKHWQCFLMKFLTRDWYYQLKSDFM